MGWFRPGAAVLALVATLAVACTDPTAPDAQGSDPTPGASPLALSYTGAVLHKGDYCHFLQQAIPGNNTLPVEHGCLFHMEHPADLFATDGQNYSVSEVVGDVQLAVRGPADSKVMIACRMQPRIEFWFWISADGHWNIASVPDVHNPEDLVSAQDEESMRQYVKVGSLQNHMQFKCAGGSRSRNVTLAINMNGHQFAALSIPMPAPEVSLARPATPWFVDVGARLTSAGALDGTAAALQLYQNE